MTTDLLEIQPRELRFTLEIKKQSVCSIRLINKSQQHHVAFKVKTTNPKKYCVRPNVGIVKPNSVCDFTVTMQAQRAPLELVCKDKFLIQSLVVPIGTTDDDITSSMFSKDGGKYIEESKLRVVLVSPENSPVSSNTGTPDYESSRSKKQSLSEVTEVKLAPDDTNSRDGGRYIEESKLKVIPDRLGNSTELSPINGTIENSKLKLIPDRQDNLPVLSTINGTVEEGRPKAIPDSPENSPLLSTINGTMKQAPIYESLETKKQLSEVKLTADDTVSKDLQESKASKDKGLNPTKDVEERKLVEDVEMMKSKLNEFESKLTEAQAIISMLTEARDSNIRDRKLLQQELDASWHNKGRIRRGGLKREVGFPFLFVCMVALISAMFGHLFSV